MNLTAAMREVLRQHPAGLSPAQLVDVIKRDMPHLYNTERHRESLEKKTVTSLDHALKADIYFIYPKVEGVEADKTVHPMRLLLTEVSGDNLTSATEPSASLIEDSDVLSWWRRWRAVFGTRQGVDAPWCYCSQDVRGRKCVTAPSRGCGVGLAAVRWLRAPLHQRRPLRYPAACPVPCPGCVSSSNRPRYRRACSVLWPHISADGISPPHTAGRSGCPKMRQRASSPSWMQRTPAGLPWGMPGMGELMEGAVQQAPQPGRQFMVFAIDCVAATACQMGGRVDFDPVLSLIGPPQGCRAGGWTPTAPGPPRRARGRGGPAAPGRRCRRMRCPPNPAQTPWAPASIPR